MISAGRTNLARTFSRLTRAFCRKAGLTLFILMLAAACTESEPDQKPGSPENRQMAAAPFEGTIVAMGNSLTEGYGLDPENAYPALLGQTLAEKGRPFRVINAGVSGETSSGAASRTDWVLKLDPDIVIVETGANDAFGGIDTQLIKANIARIIERFQSQGVIVILAGMKMVTNLGPEYTDAFENLYHQLAREHDVIFMPFFLDEVAAKPELNLPDGIHPNARGHAVIAENLMPYVLSAIERYQIKQAVPAAD